MRINHEQLKQGFANGLRKGWSAFLWTAKIVAPISFVIAILEWSGWIQSFDHLIQPLMGFLGLPGMAALPIGIAFFAGMYSGMGALAVLPFTKEQMTLIAIFMMIAHSLIQETFIQGQSGLHPVKGVLFRLGAAVVTVMACAQILDPSSEMTLGAPLSPAGTLSLTAALEAWALSTLRLLVRIFVIMTGILIVFETMKVLGWIRPLVNRLAPFLRFLGLSQKVATLWIAGALFGLVFGAAILVEESKEGQLSKEELEGLQLSIAIHHSIIEDPLIFMTMGLNVFWLVIPRLIMSILVVRLHRLYAGLRRGRPGKKPPDTH